LEQVQKGWTLNFESNRTVFPVIHNYYSTMVTVAVAGGTGNVGRTIVDALKKSQKHDVIVLTRKVKVNGIQEDYIID
jgi:hypothetical protein